MARIIWKENVLLNVRLKDNLYTIAQLLSSPYVRFFNVQSSDGNWKNMNLNDVEIIFDLAIGNVVLRNLVVGKLNSGTLIASDRRMEKYWISPNISYDVFPFKGGDLIELGPDTETTTAPVIKKDLNVRHDLELIKKYELINMWGDEDLSERLITFFEKGDKWDIFKEKVFPELSKLKEF